MAETRLNKRVTKALKLCNQMSNVIHLFEKKAAEPNGHAAAEELHMIRATLDKCVYELSKQSAAVERTVDAIADSATRARLKDLARVNRQSLEIAIATLSFEIRALANFCDA